MKDKILVVEDDAAILSGLVDLLAGEGFEVCSATDGNEALRVYQARKPDLILLDIMIP
jgi:DNA-binding response OmpR family regulator